MPINGNKSYTGFIGLGILFLARGLGFGDELQTLALQVGFPEDGDAWATLVAFFGSLAGVGITHKLAKAAKAAKG